MANIDVQITTSEASAAVSEILGAFIGLTVDLKAEGGYPTRNVHVMRVDSDGDLVICETDDDGVPITNSTWAVPQTAITRVATTTGDDA